jgi:hypothetical protein
MARTPPENAHHPSGRPGANKRTKRVLGAPKNLTLTRSRCVSRGFTTPSCRHFQVSERQLAPEKAHPSIFDAHFRLPKTLTSAPGDPNRTCTATGIPLAATNSRKISPETENWARQNGSRREIGQLCTGRPPVKPHRKASQAPIQPQNGLQVLKNLTSARQSFPIRLTGLPEQPIFSLKSGVTGDPESAHRCNSCNITRAHSAAGVPTALAPGLPHPCPGVKNPSLPEPAHVLSRTASPASPNPVTRLSRSSSPDLL